MQSNPEQYINAIKEKYSRIIDFIDKPGFNEEDCQNFLQNFQYPEKYELKGYLRLIANIINHHHRSAFFFSKIELILLHIKKDITQYLTNIELYGIFLYNSKILLFLIQENILILNQYIVNTMIENTLYMIYFGKEIIDTFPEYKDLIEDCFNMIPNYETMRLSGETQDLLCTIIRKDSIDEFISFVNENKIDLSSQLKIFSDFCETNYTFLIDGEPTIIEYAAFNGSIQIFKYLIQNEVSLNSSKLMKFAIHGRNLDIIHILEDANIKPDKDSYKESIKCHHNEIRNYIKKKYFNDIENIDDEFSTAILKYCNYSCITNNIVNESKFSKFCKYDYFHFVELLLKAKKIDINKKIEKNIDNEEMNIIISHTNLFIALNNFNFDIAKLLLEQKDIDINAICYEKRTNKVNGMTTEAMNTAISSAIYANSEEVLKIMLSKQDVDLNKRIYDVIISNNEKINENTYCKMENVKELKTETSYLQLAILQSTTKIVQILLEDQRIDVNDKANLSAKSCNKVENDVLPAFFSAVETGKVDLIELFLKNPKLNVNAKANFSLTNINKDDDKKENNFKYNAEKNILSFMFELPKLDEKVISSIVDLILARQDFDFNARSSYKKIDCDDIDEGDETIFYTAVKNDHSHIADEQSLTIKALMSNSKIDVNAKSTFLSENKRKKIEKSYSPFHYAVINNRIKLVKLLLSYQAIDFNILNNESTLRVPSYDEVMNAKGKDEDYISDEEEDKEESENTRKLFNTKIVTENNKDSVLYIAYKNKNVEMFELLLSNSQIDANIKNIHEYKFTNKLREEFTIFDAIVSDDNLDYINLIISKPEVDVNLPRLEITSSLKEVNSALSYIYHLDEVVKTIKVIPPLAILIKEYRSKLVDILLSHPNIDVNAKYSISTKSRYQFSKKEYTLLYLAIENNKFNFASKLLSNEKIDVNALNIESVYDDGQDENKRFLNNLAKLVSTLNKDEDEKESKEEEEKNDEDEKESKEEEEKNDEDEKEEEKKIDDDKFESKYEEEESEFENGEKGKVLSYHKEFTVLHFATRKKHQYFVEDLLSTPGIDVNILMKTFDTKMHDIKKVEKTAFHIAIKNDCNIIINVLLNKKETDVNMIYNHYLKKSINTLHVDKYTPLQLAIKKNNTEIVEKLLRNKKIDVNILQYSLFERFERKTNEITENRTKYSTSLYMAIDQKNTEVVRLLLKRPEVDVNGETKEESYQKPFSYDDGYERYCILKPIQAAVKKRSIDIVIMLLYHPRIDLKTRDTIRWKKYGAENMENYDTDLFQASIGAGDMNILELLLPHIEFDVNERVEFQGKKTQLFLAIHGFKSELLDILLNQKDIDVNALSYFKSGEYTTPLFTCVLNMNFYAFKKLINRLDTNANTYSKLINGVTSEETTPLIRAIKNELIDYIKLLLQRQDVDINLPEIVTTTFLNDDDTVQRIDVGKFAPLFYAVQYENCEILKLLLDRKDIKINQLFSIESKGEKTISHEMTALHRAVLCKNYNAIKLLLEQKDIDTNVKNDDGKMPVELTDDNDIIELFKK